MKQDIIQNPFLFYSNGLRRNHDRELNGQRNTAMQVRPALHVFFIFCAQQQGHINSWIWSEFQLLSGTVLFYFYFFPFQGVEGKYILVKPLKDKFSPRSFTIDKTLGEVLVI